MKKMIKTLEKWFHHIDKILWGILIDFIFKRMVYKSDWIDKQGQWNISFFFEPEFITRIMKPPFRRDITIPEDGIFNFTWYQLNKQWLFKDVKLHEEITVDFYIVAKDIKVKDIEKKVRHELLANSSKIEIPTNRIVDISVSIINRNKIQDIDETLIFDFLLKQFKIKREEVKPNIIPEVLSRPLRKPKRKKTNK